MTVAHHAGLLSELKELGYTFKVIYDVGANIGRWTRAAMKLYPNARYELFEPLAGRARDIDNQSMIVDSPRITLHSVAQPF